MIIQNTDNKPKVLFITNFITPYRETFFSKLCSYPGYNWLVLHAKKNKEDGRPTYTGQLSTPNLQIKYLEKKFGPFALRWQDQVVSTIESFSPNLIINLGIPSILSNWLAMMWAKKHNVKMIIWHSGLIGLILILVIMVKLIATLFHKFVTAQNDTDQKIYLYHLSFCLYMLLYNTTESFFLQGEMGSAFNWSWVVLLCLIVSSTSSEQIYLES